MKIVVEENQFHYIKIPDEINSKELISLIERLILISKVIKPTQQTKQPTGIKKEKRKYRKFHRRTEYDTREKALDILQYGYHGSKEDKQRISKIIGRSWNDILKNFHSLRIRYNIQANEIGLKRWRNHYESRMVDLKVPNWTIKSYTGIFDKNGNKNED